VVGVPRSLNPLRIDRDFLRLPRWRSGPTRATLPWLGYPAVQARAL